MARVHRPPVADHGDMTSLPLSPTARTTIVRGRKRAVSERDQLLAFLAEAPVAHLGVVVDGQPVVLPTAFAVDPAGPDEAGSLYLHGSVAARWLQASADVTVCVTVTELDGYVLGRSAFHHSMNYHSAVVIGSARMVTDPDERRHALDLTVDHMVPGRSVELRPSTRKELAATAVLAVPLREASMKVRTDGPGDEPDDITAGSWGGHLPLRRVIEAAVPDPDAVGEVPASVRDLMVHRSIADHTGETDS